MSEKCQVCNHENAEGAVKCANCGFTDEHGINRNGQFIDEKDLEYWIETKVKPYRAQWEAKKRENELLAQIEKARKDNTKLNTQLEDAHKDNTKLKTQLEEAHKNNAKLKTQLEEALKDNIKLRTQLEEANKEIATLKNKPAAVGNKAPVNVKKFCDHCGYPI